MGRIYATLARFIRDSTAAGRALLTAANAAAQRTALGLGSAAQSDSTDFAAASHTQAWNTITSTPTTLVGYGIANAYTKTETDALVTSLLELKGDLNCSTNPNYPAANKGDAYYITAPGKVGGASGITVAIGDLVVAKEDNAGGTQAAVGASWFMLENSVTGFMMSSNNLSDLTNIATARANLGLGSAALSASSDFATAVHNHDDRYYTESEVDSLLSGLTPSSHAHGNITNAGAIGSTANLPLITTTSGLITTGAFGTTINTFCQGNDSRLSDARAPLTHNQAWSTITSTPTTLAGYGITDAITAAAASSTYLPRTGGVMTGPITFPAATISSSALRLTPSLVNPTTLADGDMWYAGSILQVRVGAGSRRVAWQNVDNSFIAKQTFLTSTTVSAGVRIPHGTSASLTSPVNGDIWSHTSGWYVRTNGVTEQLCTLSNTATLTNKSISGSTNTFSNIPHTAITGLGSAATASTTDFAAASHNHDDRYFTEAETTSLLAGYQALDSDLTAIAALTTTAFGRSLLTQVDAAAVRTAIGAGVSSFDGAYSSLSGIPSTFTPSAHNQAWNTITSTPTTILGYGITDAYTKSEIDTFITGLLELKNDLDCSASPNYPSASKGDAYYVSVAGKVGGASGVSVDVGDVVVAKADNAGGTQAAVGTSWFVLEHNVVGALMASNNLSDLSSAATARSNLGLGTLATQNGTISDYLTTATASSTYQPLDADLTAIGGLAGTSGLLRKTAADTWSLDTATYSTFDGAYSSLSGIPSTFTPASHVHGNITNAGAIGSTANLPLITTTSGVITVGAFGTTASTFCEGNDSRLSDARTPTAHNQAWSTITSTPTTLSGYGITDALTAATAASTYLALAGGTVAGAVLFTTNTQLQFASSNHRIFSDNSSFYAESSGDVYVRRYGTSYFRVNMMNATTSLRGAWAPMFCITSGGISTAAVYFTTSGTDLCLRSDSGTKIRNLADSADADLFCRSLTLSGKTTFVTADSSAASITLPHGSAPSSPVNGDVWSTTVGLFMRINGGTEQFCTLTNSVTLTNKTLTAPVISTISNTGTLTLPTSTDTLVGRATTDTLTNKRWQKRVVSTTSASSLTPDISAADFYEYTALAAGLTVNNPTGTPVNTELLDFRFRDNGSARSLTWGAQFRSMTATLPTTTVANKTHRIRCEWNATTSTWDCLAVSVQP